MRAVVIRPSTPQRSLGHRRPVHQLSADGLTIGESGTAPLAGLRALQDDARAAWGPDDRYINSEVTAAALAVA